MDPEKQASLHSLAARIVGTLVVLMLVFYPLSIGPAVFFMERHAEARTVQNAALFNKVYGPVFSIVGSVPMLLSPFSEYLGFWIWVAKRR